MNFKIGILGLAFLLLTSASAAAAPGAPEIMKEIQVDLNHDGVNETVTVSGCSVYEKSKFRMNLELSIKDGATQKISKTKVGNAGYEVVLETVEVTGESPLEILVSVATGANKGVRDFQIFTWGDKGIKPLFTPENQPVLEIKGQLGPDFQALLTEQSSGAQFYLDVQAGKERYVKEQVYGKEGTMKSKILIQVDSLPLIALQAVDKDGDGTQELLSTQELLESSSRIAKMTALWKYQNKKWVLQRVDSDQPISFQKKKIEIEKK
nr:hypothetical protein [uncultured Anaeromusa sp.]